MRELPGDDAAQLREYYRHFAAVEATEVSPLYAEWAAAAAVDEEVLRLLAEVPASKRQPNLLFAAARIHGVELQSWAQARQQVMQRWEAIAATLRARRTQTNEPGRLAVLNLAFSRIAEEERKPLALIEVGASAGLCLHPDAWPLRYQPGDQILSPAGPLHSGLELNCTLEGVEPPSTLPEVAWRAGADLNPLDLTRAEDADWLRALVWPGMEHRLERLDAGAELVAQQPPHLVAGDLNELLAGLLAQVPADAVPVVFHSAVLVYLPREERARFLEQLRVSGARWVSNEGPTVFPDIQERLPQGEVEGQGFVLTLDGEPLARTGPHGQSARALSR